MKVEEEILGLTAELIAIPSVSGEEHDVCRFLEEHFRNLGWSPERLPVVDGRFNLFVRFGVPRIVYTTHIDVVPAPTELFTPRRTGGAVYGRGACDAKGIAATMIAVCRKLLGDGHTDFGLLFVVGEEDDGVGAKHAAEDLKGAGINYLVNGEPTDGKLVIAHKGLLGVKLRFSGKACHSGYPEMGEDANRKLVEVAHALLNADLGSDPDLRHASVNIGQLKGGVADNIISPSAEFGCLIRTVTPGNEAIEAIKAVSKDKAEIEVYYDTPPCKMLALPGFEPSIASFATDIPHFAPLGAEALLFGPGSMLVGHTDHEHLTLDQVHVAFDGYLKIHAELCARQRTERGV